MKLYFSALNEEIAYPKERMLREMEENELEWIEVYEGKRMLETAFFFCKAIGFVGERGKEYEPCGKICKSYDPRNGKSGCCKHRGFCYEPGQEYILKSNGELTRIPFVK